MVVPTSFGERPAVNLRIGRLGLVPVALALASTLTPGRHALGQQGPTAIAGAAAGDARGQSPLALGLALAQAQRPHDAAAAFRQALLLAPDDALARRQLAVALLEAGEVEAAAREIEILLVCHPRWSEAHYLAALARSRLPEDESGDARIAQELERALALEPDPITPAPAISRGC
jgi:tetratricopeptide (TPR) repeat protein